MSVREAIKRLEAMPPAQEAVVVGYDEKGDWASMAILGIDPDAAGHRVILRPDEVRDDDHEMTDEAEEALVEQRLESDKPFEDVAKAFECQLGRFDPDVAIPLRAGGAIEEARAKIEAMAGPSGFRLFGTQDHGALLRLAGQKRKAVQYVVGNPLFALQMTQHDTRPVAGTPPTATQAPPHLAPTTKT